MSDNSLDKLKEVHEEKRRERQEFLMSLPQEKREELLKKALDWTLNDAMEIALETECYELAANLKKEIDKRD